MIDKEHKFCIGKDDHSWEVGYDKGYQQGRADAIAELLKELCIGCAYLKGTKCEIKGGCPCSIGQSEIIRSANKVLEQLKEQTNE